MDDESATARTRVLAATVALMAIVGLAHARPHAAERRPTRDTQHRPAPAARALREGVPVELNAADAPTLELLPGIGPALAARILVSRREHGDFSSVDDLMRVRGIGPRRLEALRPLLRVASPAPLQDGGCDGGVNAQAPDLAPEAQGG
jgi:competence ComEA-like helix-hairpin-helix protein